MPLAWCTVWLSGPLDDVSQQVRGFYVGMLEHAKKVGR